MKRDVVARIEIDSDGRLHVVPASATFPYIWREAMEVHWDADRRSLYAPPPREWSRARWLRQVLDAAREQGCELLLTEQTEWSGIELTVRREMIHEVRSPGGAR